MGTEMSTMKLRTWKVIRSHLYSWTTCTREDPSCFTNCLASTKANEQAVNDRAQQMIAMKGF